MKKRISAVFAVLAILILCVTGCGKPVVPNTPETLEIYAIKLGYGVKWLEEMIEDFKSTDWVKTKYPELDIYFSTNTERNFASDRLQSGRHANTIDLIFGMDLFSLFGANDTNNDPIIAKLDDVYSSNVPGEDITFEEKMLPSFRLLIEDSYYDMTWAAGRDGILYNADLLEDLGFEVPVTTEELEKIVQDIKAMNGSNSKYPYTYSFVSSTIEAYWDMMMFQQWWAQYEGLDNYKNFYRGISNDAYSKDIFKQRGRLESLSVMETLLKSSNGYMFDGSSALDFMEAQTRLLTGMGLFMVCGDWFDVEMSEVIKQLKPTYDYNITAMRTPVISAIVNKTPSIVALAEANSESPDAVLSRVVKAIDNNEDSYEGVSPADFNRVANARHTVKSLGYSHNAVIPDYSSAKELAKDFLRYMATDKALEIYMNATKGAALPFYYNAKQKNPNMYETFTNIQKVRNEIYYNDKFEVQIVPPGQQFPLAYYGYLRTIVSAGGDLESVFFSGEKTASQIYYGDIDYWTDYRWNLLLTSAGLL